MSFTKIQYVDNETIITAENLNAIQEAILSIDNIYPVGSIYMSLQSNSPASFIGGTWEQIMNNFLIGAGDSYVLGTTGGSLTHIHTTGNCTLTVNQMPSHSHTNYYYGGSQVSWGYEYSSGKGTISAATPNSGGIGYTGGGQAHNHGNTGSSSNMPPYLAVYMWKRIE